MTDLLNQINVVGTYNDAVPFAVTLESTVTVQIMELEVEGTADRTHWGSGPLTYIVTITNNETESYSGITVNDTLDITKVVLDESSITIDGESVPPSGYQYDPATGMLRITAGTIPPSGSKVITFQVNKIQG